MHIKKLSFFFSLCLVLSAFAVAQEPPRLEVFGGYSFLHNSTSHLNFPWGWAAAPQFNITRAIGFKADIGGHYATPVPGVNVNSYSLLFGPVISNRLEVEGSSLGYIPFLHALGGVNRISGSSIGVRSSDTAFAMMFGGGVDINATPYLSVRVGQIDYLYTQHGTASHHDNVRVSAGMVFKLGGKR